MAFEFFTWWVADVWGTGLMALFGTGALFAIIGILGKMSYMLLFTLLALYFLVFGVGFFGIVVWLPSMLFAVIYLFLSIYKFVQKD